LFEVKATNNDGFWSDKEATLRIFITPPFWFTWWAYFLYVSVLAALVYLYIRIRTNAQENELKALRKADKLKTEFLAQMSHEIRTPINVIMNFTSLVQEELESTFKEHFQEYFVNIKKAGSRVIRTIDLLLNMADVQTGTYEYVPREIHLKSDVIDNLVKEYSVFANEKKLKIEIVENGIIPTLFLDDYTVRQIFANLIDNAIKYTPKGNIKICLAIKGDEIAVSISDTGIGIKEAYIPYLFDPFTQEEQGYTRRFDGNGLGLALVKKYCDINNARIEVESQKDVGTTFTVYFQNSPRRN
jgi:signal transduction histidine kinase